MCSSFAWRGALLYFNTDYVLDRFMEALNRRTDGGDSVRLVVIFLGTVTTIDLAGAEFLTELHHLLHTRGIDLRLAEAPTAVRQSLMRSGFEGSCGSFDISRSILETVTVWKNETLEATCQPSPKN